MAAKSVNISFYGTTSPSKPVLCVWARWWDPEPLCADPRFTRTNDTGSYFDWRANLTLDEFITMHESFRDHATSGVHALPDWQAIIQPKIRSIDGAITGTLGEISKVNVEVAEWESGF
jgi:hypothetical protein